LADWYVFRHDGPPLGPWPSEQIADAILRGELSPDAWIAAPVGRRWLRALDVPVIAQRVSGVPTRRRDSGMRFIGKPSFHGTAMMVTGGEDDALTEPTLPPDPPSSPTPPTVRPGGGDTLESPGRRRAGSG
jgi:hypothetical protein